MNKCHNDAYNQMAVYLQVGLVLNMRSTDHKKNIGGNVRVCIRGDKFASTACPIGSWYT